MYVRFNDKLSCEFIASNAESFTNYLVKIKEINFLNKQFLAPNFAMLDGNSEQISSTQVFCRCFGRKF